MSGFRVGDRVRLVVEAEVTKRHGLNTKTIYTIKQIRDKEEYAEAPEIFLEKSNAGSWLASRFKEVEDTIEEGWNTP